MAVQTIAHPSIDERRANGKEALNRTPVSSHQGWRPAGDRPDPVALLEEQNVTREPDLVPVRHGRMMVSPFTFYRGAARIIAADLKDTPVAGLEGYGWYLPSTTPSSRLGAADRMPLGSHPCWTITMPLACSITGMLSSRA